MTNEVIQNILTRCNVRAYDDRPVEREKIDTLSQCAVHAPSAMNRQTWHFSAVLNREKIAKLTAAVGKALGNEKYDMYKPAALICSCQVLTKIFFRMRKSLDFTGFFGTRCFLS